MGGKAMWTSCPGNHHLSNVEAGACSCRAVQGGERHDTNIAYKNQTWVQCKHLTAATQLYLWLSAFSFSKFSRTLWASSSSAVGVCEMSSWLVGASRGSTRLWNNLCLIDGLVGVAQAAALALGGGSGRYGERATEEQCDGVTSRTWFYNAHFKWCLSNTRKESKCCSQLCKMQLNN